MSLRSRRGVILTLQGWSKFQDAKAKAEWTEKAGDTFSLEELSDRTKLARHTISKILGCLKPVDKSSLVYAFAAFGLELTTGDYTRPSTPSEDLEVQGSNFQHDWKQLRIDPIIQQRLYNRGYSVKSVLGFGGFGITYLVEDTNKSNKNFVIKTLKPESIQFNKINNVQLEKLNRLIKSFKNEARILLHCSHKNIVQIHSFFSEEIEFLIDSYENQESMNNMYNLEILFLVMEYIYGQTLFDLIDIKGILSEAEALRYISQICEALICVHNQFLLHRDITPQNIMVRKATSEAVLIDFGLARDFLPELTRTYTLCGTENFSAPELLRKKTKLGDYTDIYSLAATLYYLLTKESPTSASNRRLGDALREPKEINNNISDRVNEAILWGMELDFKERPQTVQEWLQFLNPNKIKFDDKVLANSPDELKKAIITYFCPSELNIFLVGLSIDYKILTGKYLPDKVKSLIAEDLQEEDAIKSFIKEMKSFKPEAFI